MPMSVLDEFRTKQPLEERKSPLWSILGIVAAFVVGGALEIGWESLSRDRPGLFASAGEWFKQGFSAGASTSVIRLGNPRTAPLLRSCFRARLEELDAPGLEAPLLYGIMHESLKVRHPGDRSDRVAIAAQHGRLADCVSAESAALCDIDNRALVIEATGDFLTALVDAEVELARLSPAERAKRERGAEFDSRVKDRILGRLAGRVREGRLTVADFGYRAHPEVKQAIKAAGPAPDTCAKV
jgi:hypothetical protein